MVKQGETLKAQDHQDSLKHRNQSATTSLINGENESKKHRYLFTIDELKSETRNLELHQKFFLFFGIMWFLFVIVILANLDSSRNKEVNRISEGESLRSINLKIGLMNKY